MTTKNQTEIIMYGTNWCGDCHLARMILGRFNIPYTDIDIDSNPEAEAIMLELNDGSRTVPTIIFPDGSKMLEPSRKELQEKLKSLALI